MQFTIITALMAILAFSLKSIETAMSRLYNGKWLILNHEVVKEDYRDKRRDLYFRHASVVTYAIIFLILTQDYSGDINDIKILIAIEIIIGIIGIVALYVILEYINTRLKEQIHGSIEIAKNDSDKMLLFCIFFYLFFIFFISMAKYNIALANMNTDESSSKMVFISATMESAKAQYENEKAENIIMIVCVIIAFMFIINVSWLIIDCQLGKEHEKKLNENSYYKSAIERIQLKKIKTGEIIPISITKQSISIDKDGIIWIFERDNVKKNIEYCNLDEVYLIIGKKEHITKDNYESIIKGTRQLENRSEEQHKKVSKKKKYRHSNLSLIQVRIKEAIYKVKKQDNS